MYRLYREEDLYSNEMKQHLRSRTEFLMFNGLLHLKGMPLTGLYSMHLYMHLACTLSHLYTYLYTYLLT